MDLVLSLTIETLGMKTADTVVKSHHEDWLQNANADLMKIFNQSEVDEKIEDIKKTNEINLDNLDICYEAGQYYVVHEDTHHPLNDQDKIYLPGYVVTVHIRNNLQVNALSVDSRYSEDLIDFEHLIVEPDAIHSPTVHSYFSEAVGVKKNALEHYIDLPHMVQENCQDRQQIERDRDEFHPSLIMKSQNKEEHNILNTLGIHEQSDGFFNYADAAGENLFGDESENIAILDEMYEDTRRNHHYYTKENKVEQKVDIKKNLRSRLDYLKKAIIGP